MSLSLRARRAPLLEPRPVWLNPFFTVSTHRITLRHIAERFGCSRATVSLALSDHPRIRPDVRRRVRELAEQMGYRPDPTLSMIGRSRFSLPSSACRAAFAYLVDTREPQEWRRLLQFRYLDAARRRAAELGYTLEKFDLAGYGSGEAASNVLHHRGVEGVIIPQMSPGVGPMLRHAGWERFVIVGSMLGWVNTPYHTVRRDVFNDFRRLWQEAVSRGYRRIGGAVFQHDPIAQDDYSRYGAAVAMQRQLVPARRRVPLFMGPPREETAAAFITWVKKHRPDAIVSFIESPHHWLTRAKFRVPEDIAFACASVDPKSPQLTGVAAMHEEVGEAAIDFLVSHLQHHHRGIPAIQQVLLLEGRWIEGVTLPRATT